MSENIQEEIEDKIIDHINSGSASRLVIFKPEFNSFGADLAVERRAQYEGGKKMYFKINSLVIPAKNKSFAKDFPQDAFKADSDFYLLFVYFDEIKQKIDDNIWLIPSLDFEEITPVIKSDGYPPKKLLRFESSLNLKSNNQYSKFLININELGKLILSAFETGGKFSFKDPTLGERKINLEKLKEFLNEARKNTYASNEGRVDNPRLMSSEQLEFQKGDYFYRDVYFNGRNRFIGQEIVYLESDPIWGMNYIGDAMGRSETAFLKESLFNLSDKCRFGQICEYEKRELKYQDKGCGSLDNFYGEEKIFSNEKNIYKLNYRGGIISDKL